MFSRALIFGPRSLNIVCSCFLCKVQLVSSSWIPVSSKSLFLSCYSLLDDILVLELWCLQFIQSSSWYLWDARGLFPLIHSIS